MDAGVKAPAFFFYTLCSLALLYAISVSVARGIVRPVVVPAVRAVPVTTRFLGDFVERMAGHLRHAADKIDEIYIIFNYPMTLCTMIIQYGFAIVNKNDEKDECEWGLTAIVYRVILKN
jgi:hypothetical protein